MNFFFCIKLDLQLRLSHSGTEILPCPKEERAGLAISLQPSTLVGFFSFAYGPKPALREVSFGLARDITRGIAHYSRRLIVAASLIL